MKGQSMHPNQKELTAYLRQKLEDDNRAREIQEHLLACEFCSNFCADYQDLTQPVDQSVLEELPNEARDMANLLYERALAASMIELTPLISDESSQGQSYLAADGDQSKPPAVQNLLTLYSESPEIVLRVMREPDRGGDYIQLMTEEPDLAAHALIRLPELERDFVTDESGRAEVDLAGVDNLERLKWQIKMPDASFELTPLKADSQRVESFRLETERDDLIEVQFEGKTVGKQLSIRLIRLDGQNDYEPVRVAVCCGRAPQLETLAPGKLMTLGSVDSETTISIRLYQ